MDYWQISINDLHPDTQHRDLVIAALEIKKTAEIATFQMKNSI